MKQRKVHRRSRLPMGYINEIILESIIIQKRKNWYTLTIEGAVQVSSPRIMNNQ